MIAESTTAATFSATTMTLKFAQAQMPEYSVMSGAGNGYIKFGKENDYPGYLLSLFDKSEKHSALISGKAGYVTGNGWKAENEADTVAMRLIAAPNASETLDELSAKLVMDEEIFGGYYIEVIRALVGDGIAALHHVEYRTVRTNKDCTQFWVKEDWKTGREKPEVLPAFRPNGTDKSSIIYVRTYRPGLGAYALPGYLGSLNYIEASIEVSKHTLGNASTGFTPSKLITLPNGEPTDDQKREITRGIERVFTGPDGKKFIVSFVDALEKKWVVEDLGVSDLTKEDFTAVDTMIRSNIFAGHQVTTPAIFGISEPGKLGNRSEMRDGYEIFKATYANKKQRAIEGVINRIAKLMGATSPLKIQESAPIGYDLNDTALLQYAPVEWIREKMGIDASQYPSAATAPGMPAGADPAAMQEAGAAPAAPVNDAVRNLTAKQHQQLLRIIRQFGKDQITEAAAKTLLRTSLGLSDEEIAELLGTGEAAQFSEELTEDEALQVFAEYGEDAAGFLPLRSRRVTFQSDEDMARDARETGAMEMQFTAIKTQQIQANVLDLMAKDKRITPEVLAETLGVEVAAIKRAIAALAKAGSISVQEVGGVTERTLTKPLDELAKQTPTTTEFMIRYAYDGPRDSRNRPFCAKLMELNRLYSRADIETMSARLGYSVFDRRGGWYTPPGTNDPRPSCRHYWTSQVVMKQS